MSDLSFTQSAQLVGLTGMDSSGLETNTVRSTADGDLNVADLCIATGAEAALTVGVSAVEVKCGVAALASRKIITLYNNSIVTIYWGRTSGVTTLTGTPVFPGQLITWEGFSANKPIYVIAATAGNNARITES